MKILQQTLFTSLDLSLCVSGSGQHCCADGINFRTDEDSDLTNHSGILYLPKMITNEFWMNVNLEDTFRSCFKNWEASKPRSEVKCKFHGLVRYNFGTFYLSVRYIFNYVFLFHSLLLLFVLIWLLQQIFCKVHNIKCSKIRNSCIIPNLKSNIESLIKFKENSFPRWQHTGSMTIARLQNLSDQSTTL